jgi:SOS-response transcriptional repressor LexA
MKATMKNTTRRLLEAIRANERGSYQEWREACGMASSSSVLYHLLKLEEEGLVRRHPGMARSVELIREEAPHG